MPTKRYAGPLALMRISPKPSKVEAKSLSIRLDFQKSQDSVEFDLTSNEAMLLLKHLQTFQKRYGWPSGTSRVLTRRDLN